MLEDAEKAVKTYLTINPDGEGPPFDMLMTDPAGVARVYWKAVKTGKRVEVKTIEDMPDTAKLELV